MKKKNMIITIIAVYLAVSTLAYLFFGGFYLTKKYGNTDLSANHNSIDQLDTTNNNTRKGVFAGFTNYNKQKCYSFQFKDMFADKNRLLNIYYPVNEHEVYFVESNKKLSGQDALLVVEKQSPSEKDIRPEFVPAKIFHSYYETAKLPDPQLFAKKLGANIQADDSFFVLSFNIEAYNRIKMLQFTKNAYGFYGLRRYEKFYKKENWKLKDKSGKKKQFQKKATKNILIAVVDIITGGIQLIIAIFYYIYLLIRLIIGIFTGGMVK